MVKTILNKIKNMKENLRTHKIERQENLDDYSEYFIIINKKSGVAVLDDYTLNPLQFSSEKKAKDFLGDVQL